MYIVIKLHGIVGDMKDGIVSGIINEEVDPIVLACVQYMFTSGFRIIAILAAS
jgi:hypothetical protein